MEKERGKPCEKAGRKNGQELNIKFPVFSLNYTNSGHSVNVSKNKMAYEVILAYYLHMPLLLAFFSYFLT